MRRIIALITVPLALAASAVSIQTTLAPSASALDNGLARTPPMGWNDWNAFKCNVSEQLVEQTAVAIHTNGMQAAGYRYVNIDDCWAEPQRDANGNLVPDPAKFPDGIKSVADYVHSLGLKLGIYEDSGTHTCSKHGFPGSLGHEYQDALTFAQWGVDYLKYDDCNIPPDGQNQQATIQRYDTMRNALRAARAKTGHAIVFSICEKTDYGVPNSTWPPVGNLWRTTGDIHDTYASMLSNFTKNVQLASLARPGAWNDPNMLEIGNGGMTATEEQTEFSLWAEMAAPLIAGTDLRSPSPQTLATYTNRAVIAVDQDRLGRQGYAVQDANGLWVLTKPLAGGSRALVLFNSTDAAATISTTAAQAGLRPAPSYSLRDLWEGTTTGTTGTISGTVPAHGVIMYRVTRSGSPWPIKRVFNVRDYGAAGNGTTNDTPAINAAITAANANATGGTVEFPAGTYLAGASIHMLSHVTVTLDKGSTITAAAAGFDPPEPNQFSQYQDFGHSHFHDAVIWGENLTDVGFTGSGTITGAGHLTSGNPKPGQADKLISLVNVDGLNVSGVTLQNGGHFALLIDHCTNVTSDHLTIATAPDRDGWNVIDTTNVRITNINVASNDDALVFKSDYALGQTFNSGNVVVTNAHLSAKCCNALMFGSETCGNFTHYTFNNINITGAGKSGLGMVSEDGAHISDVTYNHVVMSGTQSPIMEKIGTRLRCGGSPSIGSISDIHYNDVTGTGAGAYSPTLWGQPGHPITDVTFTNVHLTLPGGAGPIDPNTVPSDNGDYNPNSIGTRPAYGFYLHNVAGISFDNTSFRFTTNDQRPAFIANAGSDITLRNTTLQSGTGSPFDIGFQGVTGHQLIHVRTTTGAAPRVEVS
ncbi:MAG TPA: glycosyl hydrolase family 28 protein [Streptosporangiaceae bacterium]